MRDERRSTTHLSRRRFLQATAAVGAAVGLGGVAAACSAIGGGAQGGTFNWMTWGDHYIDKQLKAIETSDKIVANISELAGNAEGYAKLKEVKGQLDMMSADALWVRDAYNKDGPHRRPSTSTSSRSRRSSIPFARKFEIWTTPGGLPRLSVRLVPDHDLLRPGQGLRLPRQLGGPASTRSTRAGSSSRTSPRRSSPTWRGRPASTSRTT